RARAGRGALELHLSDIGVRVARGGGLQRDRAGNRGTGVAHRHARVHVVDLEGRLVPQTRAETVDVATAFPVAPAVTLIWSAVEALIPVVPTSPRSLQLPGGV